MNPGGRCPLANTPISICYGKYENGVQVGGRIAYVELFSLIASFILLIACINYMNLSTARASRRMKEVGVKKSLGAGRRALIFQYLGESMMITIFAVVLAILLTLLLLPYFNDFTNKDLVLTPDRTLLLSMSIATVLTGLISGSYPALYLSSFKPVLIFKGTRDSSFGAAWLRKGLVISQFTISIILVAAVIVVYHQMAFVQSKDLGYDKENIVLLKREGELNKSYGQFLRDLKNSPGVIGASGFQQDLAVKSNGTSTTYITWPGKDEADQVTFKYISVD